ncbi:MAG: prepilin-type N-terminal cleavage/methylation domain-containing protein [bacterium]
MRQKSFTLIELLIVVAIIGILAAIAVPNFLQAQIRAKIAKVHGDMRNLKTAIESYRIDTNEYPYFDEYGYAKSYNPITYRLIPLTTPVSYMSSISLEDPFLEVQGGEGYEDELPRFSYNYRNYKYFSPDGSWKAWVLNSLGPDRTKNQGLQVENWARGLVEDGVVIIYDATNGLVSAGDMPYTGGETKFRANF